MSDVVDTGAKKVAGEPGAIDQLVQSRERVRGALDAIAHPPAPPPLSVAGGPAAFGRALLHRVRSQPGVSLAADALASMWNRHPARRVAEVALAASRPVVARTARRDPVSLGIGAVGLGTLLVLVKPWRLLLRPKSVVKTLPKAARQVMKEAAKRSNGASVR